ncbi:glutamate receptor ionotropic, kainate glr-3-like isoform X2 [Dermatophagoides pteronyssinus]
MTKLNLAGQQFRVGFNVGVPFLRMSGWNETNHSYKNIDGIDSWILRILMEYYNITFQLNNCYGQYGIKNENGTSWTGLIGKIVRNEIDIGIGGVMLSQERYDSINFLHSYWITHYTFATTKSTYDTNLFKFLQPFQMEIWYCLIILLLSTWIIDQIFKHFIRSNSNLIIITLMLLIQRPYRKRNLNSSDKLWIFIFSIISLIIVNHYSGNLGSMLTIRDMIEINSIDQLADECQQRKIIPLVLKNSIGMKFLQQISHTDNHLNKIRNSLQSINNYKEGMDLITTNNKQKRLALIGDRERLLFGQLRFGYYLPPEQEQTFFFSSYFSMAIRLKFEYRKQFDIV